jgi:hypothetical protein
MYMRIFGWLDATVTAQLVSRTFVAVIAAFVRTPNTRAAYPVLSNLVASVGSSLAAIAAYRFSLNAPSSVGASITVVALQAGVG